MHEYALTKQIVQIVNDTASSHKAKAVCTVYLVIGSNTGIVPDSVQMYYDQIAKGTLAEGALLDVRILEAQMYCPACNAHFVRPRFSFACPNCGTLGTPTDFGNECYVESIELDGTEDAGEETVNLDV